MVAFGPDNPPTLSGCGSVVSVDEIAAVFGAPQTELDAEPSPLDSGRNWLAIYGAGVGVAAVGGLVMVVGQRYLCARS